MHRPIQSCIRLPEPLHEIVVIPKKARCLNFVPGARETSTVIQERNSIPRNTWMRLCGECCSTSVNASWTLTLKCRPAGFSVCWFCALAVMVGVVGKLILKQCFRPASAETDGIFNSAISADFTEKFFKYRCASAFTMLWCFSSFYYPSSLQSLAK